MTIQPGDRLPSVDVRYIDDGVQTRDVAELFAGQRVLLFAVPGAFTPTCSAKHLPGYVEMADAIAGKGIDLIACLSVNDAFVMQAWGEVQKTGDKVMMLADGNADLTRALGLETDSSAYGMGLRSKRYAMIIQDGVVEQLFVEQPGEFRVSSAAAVYAKL